MSIQASRTSRASRIALRVTAALAWLVLAPVHLYRALVSPLKRAPTCRFAPTCSQYAIDAVRTRGVVVGIGLAAWRVGRCNPFGGSGFDPVPPRCAHGAQEVELH